MNNQQHDSDVERDEALSSEYRRIASESAPARLDKAVLREARRAARQASTPSWSPFLRPLSIFASIAIVLAIVLQFSESELALQGEQHNGDSRLPVQAGGVAHPGRDAIEQRYCSEEQAAGRDAWLSCIDELRDSGHAEAAHREQALFDERYRK